jgi:aspartyl-tRNA(Asn)/glutamyl-tRNA(Gln) amidotransferase subunit A
LREAGAVIIGKCNLHELALGTTSDESAFGAVHNPHDPTRSPGGSSGGSAAAVAAGMGWASIGTDTGGSIRIPAAACGVVGLKPTFGEIPTTGVVPLSVSLDHVGPLARTVRDAWAIYAALVGSTPPPESADPVKPLRLGRLGGYFMEKLDADVRRRFEEALDRLKTAGAIVIDLELGRVPDIAATYVNVVLPEAYAYYAESFEKTPELFATGIRERLAMGSRISRDDYVKAQGDRAPLRAAVDTALSGCDALVLPTVPLPAQKIGTTTARIDAAEEPLRPLTLRLTQLFNLTGHPAISIPSGETSAGMPSGLQLVGRRHQTSELSSVALRCEPYVTLREPSSSGPR